MKRILISIIVCIFTVITSSSVELGGINYTINTSNNTATVIKSEVSGDLVIPENIKVDGVDYEVIEIEKYAFQTSQNMTSVKLPRTIKTIGALAFANGNDIIIYISDLSSWCSIDYGYARSFAGGKYEYKPIGKYRLFLNEVEVTNLEIPSDIFYIRKNAFSGCNSITQLSIHDNLSCIDDYAFYSCTNLKTIMFGHNVNTIGEYCFCKCGSIENLTLPQSLQTLRRGALQSLDGLTELIIPGNVKTIESGCFLNDTNLFSVKFEDSEKDIFIGSGQYDGDPIFIGCPLQEVYIGRNLKSKTMTSNTGYSVPPFKNQTGLISVTIGEGVKILDSYLFAGCSSLTTINTPNSLEEIGYGIFQNCTSLPIINNIRYADKCAISVIDNDEDNFILSSDTRIISHYCFSNCKKMKSITLPDNIVYWGDGVFSGCSSLSEITIPENVKTIGGHMFYECESLLNVNIPSNVNTIKEYAFAGCKSLKEIVIPKNVYGIYDNAFNGCESLVRIKIEDSKNNIGLGTSGYSYKSLFIDCPLEEVYIGRNLGMYYSSGQENDYLPFYNKKSIKKLTIGAEVTKIWDYSFYGCIALENIFALSEQPISLKNNTFSRSIYSTCKLNVLPNSISLYSSADIWKNFQNIIDIPTSIRNAHYQLNMEKSIYDLNGILGNKTSGIKIFMSKDGKTQKILMK